MKRTAPAEGNAPKRCIASPAPVQLFQRNHSDKQAGDKFTASPGKSGEERLKAKGFVFCGQL
jgi:hypothetical protein